MTMVTSHATFHNTHFISPNDSNATVGGVSLHLASTPNKLHGTFSGENITHAVSKFVSEMK